MIACCPAHSPFMLSQSASLRGTPHYINARTLSGLPCLTPAVAARPIRRRALYVASAEPSPSEQIVRIKVKSYELPLVKESVSVILAAAKDTGIELCLRLQYIQDTCMVMHSIQHSQFCCLQMQDALGLCHYLPVSESTQFCVLHMSIRTLGSSSRFEHIPGCLTFMIHQQPPLMPLWS